MTLCQSCRWKRDVISGKGSRFLLCELSHTDPRFPKYPPQPVVSCTGYQQRSEPERSSETPLRLGEPGGGV